jgi:hypothetical protein
LRLKKLYIAAAATLLFWGPSIGSSGMTDAVQSGSQVHRAAFGWQGADAAEARELSAYNDVVFTMAASDSDALFSAKSSR